MPIMVNVGNSYKEVTAILDKNGNTIDTVYAQNGSPVYSAWKSMTLTGVPPLPFKAKGTPLTALSMLGNTQQTGTPSPDNIIMPTFCGVRTGNLWCETGFSARAITSTHEHVDVNSYGTTLSTTIGKEVVITQSAYPTGTVGYQNGFFFIDVDFSKYEIGDKITLSFDYIVNEVHALSSQSSTTLYAGKNSNVISPTLTSGDWNISGRLTAVITIIADMSPYVEVRLCGNSITVKNIMLNAGTKPLPYEPYGWAEKITCAGQTTPIYLGEVPTVRRIKKLVLDGTEGWVQTYNGAFYIDQQAGCPSDYLKDRTSVIEMCSHYNAQISVSGSNQVVSGNIAFFGISGATYELYIAARDVASADDFKAYLAQQYANGTPVTVWYVLAEPETGIVNEPLAKIGDYADELHSEDVAVTIPTVKGDNTLTVDTPIQPSNVSITGLIRPAQT